MKYIVKIMKILKQKPTNKYFKCAIKGVNIFLPIVFMALLIFDTIYKLNTGVMQRDFESYPKEIVCLYTSISILMTLIYLYLYKKRHSLDNFYTTLIVAMQLIFMLFFIFSSMALILLSNFGGITHGSN